MTERASVQRRERATRLILWLAMIRRFDQPGGDWGETRRQIDDIRARVVFGSLAARAYCLAQVPEFPRDRRDHHLGEFSTLMSRVGEDYLRHVMREARRQWREVRDERSDLGPVWRTMDAATWRDGPWTPTTLIAIGTCAIKTCPTGDRDPTTFRIAILGEARRLLDAGQHPNPFTSRQEAQPA